MDRIPPPHFGAIVGRLNLAIFVFRKSRLIYCNRAAESLVHRLHSKYRIELIVILRDHLAHLLESPEEQAPALTLLTATHGEPFYVNVMLLGRHGDVAVSVRELGTEIAAFRRRYRLSPREAEVAELVLHGYRNRDIATTLGITPATAKKHLTRVFDKVGVDTRTQLVSRLA
jgi:DNA-binding CsgD family transcriptional regulator